MRAAVVILGLIFLNGLFASAELALVSARQSRLRGLAEQGHRGARAALALLEDPTRLLSSVQIGITLVGILTGVYSGAAYSEQLAAVIRDVPLLAPYAQELAFGAIVVVMTYVSLVFGELVPKRLALAHADRWATMVAVPMQFVAMIGAPVVWVALGPVVFRGAYGGMIANAQALALSPHPDAAGTAPALLGMSPAVANQDHD